MQVSEKRLAANRANALKSTGPKTPAGKRRSSQNGCKHHLYARKFRMPDAWEDWALRRAHEFIRNIDDPDLRPLVFQRVYINGRQKYFVHLCAEFFRQVRENGMAWYFANSDYIAALDRYHAHHYAETLRSTRILRRYCANRKSEPRAEAGGCEQPKPKSIAVGQTIPSLAKLSMSTEPIPPTLSGSNPTAANFSRPSEPILPRPPPPAAPPPTRSFYRCPARSPSVIADRPPQIFLN